MTIATSVYYQADTRLQLAFNIAIFLFGAFFIYFSHVQGQFSEAHILLYFYFGFLTLCYGGYLFLFQPSYSVEVCQKDITIFKQKRFLGAKTQVIKDADVRFVNFEQYKILNVEYYDVVLVLLDGTKQRLFQHSFICDKYSKEKMLAVYALIRQHFQ